MHDSRRRKTVYTFIQRDGRTWWRPMGIGFVNPDGSIDVTLDAFPQSGALQLRDADPRCVAQEGGT